MNKLILCIPCFFYNFNIKEECAFFSMKLLIAIILFVLIHFYFISSSVGRY